MWKEHYFKSYLLEIELKIILSKNYFKKFIV